MSMDKAMSIPLDWLDHKKYSYTWVTDDTKMRTEFQMDGYTAVKSTDADATKFKDINDPRLHQDGNVRIGDAILMRIPREIKIQRDKEAADRIRRALSAVKEDFHAEGARLGVPTFEDSTTDAKR